MMKIAAQNEYGVLYTEKFDKEEDFEKIQNFIFSF